MRYPIRKIEVMADKNTGHPIYYCHSEDVGHDPALTLSMDRNYVLLAGPNILYKVKGHNPQRKNRIDIYMSLDQARTLGAALIQFTGGSRIAPLRDSNANPHRAATGDMALPEIIWAKYCKHSAVFANFPTNTGFEGGEGYLNVDLELPHGMHVRMREHEIHIGIQLPEPQGAFNVTRATPVTVPQNELQAIKGEKNPVPKINGDCGVYLLTSVAAGLGDCLSKVSAP